MFGVRLNNVDLDIDESSKLSVEIVSTAMNDSDELIGSKSWPVLFPYSDKNKAAFKNAHLPENRSARKLKLTATITVFGTPWKECRLRYNITQKGYDADCEIDLTSVATLLKETDITQVFVNYKDGEFDSFKWIEFAPANNMGLGMKWIDDAAKNPGTTPFVFFPMWNDNKFGGAAWNDDFEESGLVNYWAIWPVKLLPQLAGSNTFYNWSIMPEPYRREFFSPQFYLSWVVKEICSFLGFQPVGDFFEHEFIKSLTIYNTGMVDKTYFTHTFKYTAARHLPKLKISEFFKAIRKDFCRVLYFDATEKKAYFLLSDAFLSNRERVNISEFVDPSSITGPYNNEKEGFEITVKQDSSDLLYEETPSAKTYRIGIRSENMVKMEMGAGTTHMADFDYYPDMGWRLPRAKQVANVYSARAAGTDAFNDVNFPEEYCKNEFSLRYLSYKGLVNTSDGDPYPYATADSFNPSGVDTYPYSCQPDGEKGILNKFNLSWFSFLLSTEKYELVSYLSDVKFRELSPIKMAAFTTSNQVRLNCVLDKGAIQYSDSRGLMGCKMTLYPDYKLDALTALPVVKFETDFVLFYAKLFATTWVVKQNSYLTQKKCSITVKFFSDAACLVPFSVTNQKVRLNQWFHGVEEHDWRDETLEFSVTGTEKLLISDFGYYTYMKAPLMSKPTRNDRYSWRLLTDSELGYQIGQTGEVPQSW